MSTVAINPNIRTAVPVARPALACWTLVRDSDPHRAIVERGGHRALLDEVWAPAIDRWATEIWERLPGTLPGAPLRLVNFLSTTESWRAVVRQITGTLRTPFVAYVASPVTLVGVDAEQRWCEVIMLALSLRCGLAFDASVKMGEREAEWLDGARAVGVTVVREPWWDARWRESWADPVVVEERHLDQIGANYYGAGWPTNWRGFGVGTNLPRRTLILRDEPLTRAKLKTVVDHGWTPAVYPHRVTGTVNDLPAGPAAGGPAAAVVAPVSGTRVAAEPVRPALPAQEPRPWDPDNSK